MSQLDGLLSGIVSDPREETRWLVLADWLQEHDRPDRAELLRLHRRLLATCLEPDAHPGRAGWHARVVELLVAGVKPCVPQETITLPGGMTMTFSYIPPGAFLMGSDHPDAHDDEGPAHRVEVSNFFMGIYPVTQAQWFAVMGTDPSRFKGPQRPVEMVSWSDCQEFCAKVPELTGRRCALPTEAEWEYAGRAGATTEFNFGDVINAGLANYDANYSYRGSPKGRYRKKTTNAGSFPPNPWGLYDVHGNVWESCAGEHAAASDRLHATEPMRTARGGCWAAVASYCRITKRCVSSAEERDNRMGFRLCLRLD